MFITYEGYLIRKLIYYSKEKLMQMNQYILF